MTEQITLFFDAWGMSEKDGRVDAISQTVTPNVIYDDPRAPESIQGVDALCEYVGMFSANAPGWSAQIVKTDVVAGVLRATVEFSGAGPDGNEMKQLGQYFVEFEEDLISRMVGFVGTGESNTQST